MASRCEMCGKQPVSGHNVSHAENKTKRRWRPNVQKTRIVVDGVAQSAYLCTRCMRTLAKAASA